jgi:hypothetical protein
MDASLRRGGRIKGLHAKAPRSACRLIAGWRRPATAAFRPDIYTPKHGLSRQSGGRFFHARTRLIQAKRSAFLPCSACRPDPLRDATPHNRRVHSRRLQARGRITSANRRGASSTSSRSSQATPGLNRGRGGSSASRSGRSCGRSRGWRRAGPGSAPGRGGRSATSRTWAFPKRSGSKGCRTSAEC